MSNKKVAIIGLGNIGKAIARNLSVSKHSFIASGKDLVKTKQALEAMDSNSEVVDVPTAIAAADILILSIPYGEIAGFLKDNAMALKGKIVVDPSNPIAPDENGGFKKIIDADASAGQLNAAALPAGVTLVKALGSLGAGSLAGASFQEPLNVLFYASDDTNVDADIEELITANGFAPVKVGGLDKSIRIEVFGGLHEFGALGKPVTVAEAKENI